LLGFKPTPPKNRPIESPLLMRTETKGEHSIVEVNQAIVRDVKKEIMTMPLSSVIKDEGKENQNR